MADDLIPSDELELLDGGQADSWAKYVAAATAPVPYLSADDVRRDMDAFDAEIERRHPRPSGWLILSDGDAVAVGRSL